MLTVKNKFAVNNMNSVNNKIAFVMLMLKEL